MPSSPLNFTKVSDMLFCVMEVLDKAVTFADDEQWKVYPYCF